MSVLKWSLSLVVCFSVNYLCAMDGSVEIDRSPTPERTEQEQYKTQIAMALLSLSGAPQPTTPSYPPMYYDSPCGNPRPMSPVIEESRAALRPSYNPLSASQTFPSHR